MYNYTITQINPFAVLKAAFCTGVCIGGILGILLGAIEGDMIGLFGGVFLGFMSGLFFGIAGLLGAAIFNALAPRIGGIGVTLEPNSLPEIQTEQADPPAPASE